MSIHWLLFVLVLVLGAQGYLYRRRALARVGYDRYFSTDTCFEGDEVQLIERISNNKLLPVPWLRLEAMMHVSLEFQRQSNLSINSGEFYQSHQSMFSMLPYTQIVRRHRIRCAKRGCYDLSTATMTSGDLIGLMPSVKKLALDCRLLVYPRPVPLADIPLPSHSWLGDLIVRRWIVDDPFIVAGVREYRYGDPLNRINWKATARSGRLQVRQHDFTADHRLMICLNIENDEKLWDAVTDPELIELGIAYAASIAEYALAQGVPTGFGCNGYRIGGPKEPVRLDSESGSVQLTALYETMAMLLVERSVTFDDFLALEVERGEAQTDYLLVTAYVDAKMQRHIDKLTELGNAVDILWLRHENEEPGTDPGQERNEVSSHAQP